MRLALCVHTCIGFQERVNLVSVRLFFKKRLNLHHYKKETFLEVEESQPQQLGVIRVWRLLAAADAGGRGRCRGCGPGGRRDSGGRGRDRSRGHGGGRRLMMGRRRWRWRHPVAVAGVIITAAAVHCCRGD